MKFLRAATIGCLALSPMLLARESPAETPPPANLADAFERACVVLVPALAPASSGSGSSSQKTAPGTQPSEDDRRARACQSRAVEKLNALCTKSGGEYWFARRKGLVGLPPEQLASDWNELRKNSEKVKSVTTNDLCAEFRSFDANYRDSLNARGSSPPTEADNALRAADSFCGGTVATGTESADAAIANVIGGLVDYLKDRAKQELVSYALETIVKPMCACDSAPRIDGELLLEKTCSLVLLPDASIDALLVNPERLRGAVEADLARLLVHEFVKLAPMGNATEKAIVTSFGQELVGLARGKNAKQFLTAVATDVDSALLTEAGTCGFETGQTFDWTCGVRLMLVAGSVAEAHRVESPTDISLWLSETSTAFCQRYGKQKSAECLFKGDAFVKTWYPRLLTFMKVVNEAKATFTAVSAAAKANKGDWSESAAPIVEAVSKLTEKTLQLAGYPQSTKVSDALELVSAYARRDTSGIQLAMRGLVGGFETKWARGLSLVLGIAFAKSQDEVKASIESAAEPAGSYRTKYGRTAPGPGLALNAFLGPFVGYQWNTNAAGDGSKSSTAYRLTAPIGLDATLGSWDDWHVGIGLVAIDPLAVLTATGTSSGAAVDWKTVVTPGAFFRVGLARTPLVFMIQGTWQPWLRSADQCSLADGTSRDCWRGGFQLGAAIAVDMPLAILR